MGANEKVAATFHPNSAPTPVRPITALVRLARAAAWYVPQILTQHHSRKTRAWNAAHPPPGHQYGATWVARRRQDLDE